MKEALAESGARPAAPAMEEIIDSYGREIWYLCLMYLKDRHLAEDAFQIALTRVWEKLDTFQGKSTLKTWIMQIAANTCRNMLRTGWYRLLKKTGPEEMLFDQAAKDDTEKREVRQAVLQLPVKYREIILLYYFQGFKIHEIASALGIREGTVSTRLKRARALLAQELKGGVEA
ncbi:MAG: sigma-70 family RNA polymerase sigma factor [Clostridiales bacterium]|nr:sigma-70 family RNA polymerase sigma factor [Clostridiales bacterium]